MECPNKLRKVEDINTESGYKKYLIAKELIEKINIFSKKNYTIQLDNSLTNGTVWLANQLLGNFDI